MANSILELDKAIKKRALEEALEEAVDVALSLGCGVLAEEKRETKGRTGAGGKLAEWPVQIGSHDLLY